MSHGILWFWFGDYCQVFPLLFQFLDNPTKNLLSRAIKVFWPLCINYDGWVIFLQHTKFLEEIIIAATTVPKLSLSTSIASSFSLCFFLLMKENILKKYSYASSNVLCSKFYYCYALCSLILKLLLYREIPISSLCLSKFLEAILIPKNVAYTLS